MKTQTLLMTTLAATLAVSTVPVLGAEAGDAGAQTPTQAPTQTQEPIYGSQLMTPQERAEYRSRMRAATTPAGREQIRREHHERMKERAKAQGLTLPEEPPARGGGMGPGGGGMGPGGGGMGPGGGRGR